MLGADEAYCVSCGSVIKKLTEVCPSCGVRQRQSGTHTSHAVTSDKNKWVALILAVALGSFGAHKFYLGKYAQGFIYLALFWTFIPMFVAFVEALIYLFTPEDSFSSRYAQRRWLSG
jgi:TM2 domain-containing membrane protein YozV